MKNCKYLNCQVLLNTENTYKTKTYCCKTCYKIEKKEQALKRRHAYTCIKCGSNDSCQWLKGPICSKCHQRDAKGSEIPKPFLTCQDCNKIEYRGKYTFKAKYCHKCRNKRYRDAKPEQYRASQTRRRLNNPESYKKAQTNFRKSNPEHFRAKAKTRNKKVKQATPKWVNYKELYNIYLNCPKGMQVDHIVPINGKNVSGLHVPWNLRYLDPVENNKKSNKFDITYLNFEAVKLAPTNAVQGAKNG